MSTHAPYMEAFEIEYFQANYCGKRDPKEAVQDALDGAQAFVNEHAQHYLESVRRGIYRAMFHYLLEPDPGERKMHLGTVACLRELGDCCHANSRFD